MTILRPEEQPQPARYRSAADDRGAIRNRIATGLVQRLAQLYGRGPTGAKAYFNDTYVFCALDGILTPSEEQLIKAGEHHLVRQYRLRFHEVTGDQFAAVVEAATGSRVISHHAKVLVDPARLILIYELERAR